MKKLFYTLTFLMLPGLPLCAQTGAPDTGAPTSLPTGGPRAALKGSYRLGPQDVLAVVVDKHPEFSNARLIVPPDGRIALPAAGSLRVNGMTAAQVERLITQRLQGRLRDPHVTVTIVQLRDASLGYVSVVGDVVKPGFVAIREGWRLSEIVAAVGGVQGRMDETRTTLARRGVPAMTVSLHAAISYPLSRANVRLRADDVVSVIRQEPARIAVNGDVGKPSVYELRAAPRLLDALVAAGGLRQRADASKAYILRGGKRIDVNLVDALELRNPLANVALRSGDFLTIEAVLPASVAVNGDVNKSGVYELRDTPRLLDAIVAAGGLRQRADMTSAFLLRRGKRIDLNLENAIEQKDEAANIALQAGDFLTVSATPPVTVSVDGFVRNPGNFSFPKSARVIQAIAQAGGLTTTPDNIVTTVRRGGQIIKVDLQRALLTDDPSADIPLQIGDTLLLSEPQVIRVQLTGAVAKPGALRLPLESRVLDALAQGGGLRVPSKAARISILRKREGGEQTLLNIDAVALNDLRDVSQNALLKDGDLVNVAEASAQSVFVSGQVQKPGSYPLEAGTGLPELITLAGGPTAQASLTRVTVRRGDKTFTVDAFAALRQGGKLDFPLQNDDFVVVQPNPNRVLMTGAVAGPGVLVIPENGTLTLAEAIAISGGVKAGAKINQVAVVRKGADGQAVARIVSLAQIGKGDFAGNVTLQSGDIVVVPEGTGKGISPLAIISSALSVGRAFGF